MGRTILILSRTYPPNPGAVGHLVKELSEALVAQGWQVTVVTSGPASESDAAVSGLRVCRSWSLPFTRKSHWLRALSYLSLYPAMFLAVCGERRPDVLVTTTDPPLQAVLGLFLKWILRCKTIHWSQDVYPEVAEEAGVLKKGGRLARGLRWISTKALQSHDRVVSIGRCMTGRLLAKGVQRERVVEIANWTDPITLRPIEAAENLFLKEQNLEGRFVAVYSGNLGLAHSFSEILESAEILQARAEDVLFLFIGEGPRRAAAESEATERKLTNCRFLPSQPWKMLSQSLSAGQVHLVSLCENLSGLVVPSKFYGGMASGRPCIYIGPGESEVGRSITENEVGRVVASGKTTDLVSAILEYRNQPEKCRTDGLRARCFGEKATLQNAVTQFQRMLDQI